MAQGTRSYVNIVIKEGSLSKQCFSVLHNFWSPCEMSMLQNVNDAKCQMTTIIDKTEVESIRQMFSLFYWFGH